MAVSRPAKGGTDSEHAFRWLLDQVSDSDDENFPHSLREAAERVRPLGRFNFLLSDGITLWAYADHSLHYLERRPPFRGRLVTLEEEGLLGRTRRDQGPRRTGNVGGDRALVR